MSISIVSGSLVVDKFGGVRVTEDGRLSVFDFISVCAESTDRKYPHYTWNRLTVRFPDLTAKCSHFKFTGRAQKETPVCDKQTALEILGLLPSATGKKYRELAAELVRTYLENPEQLAEAAIARVESVCPEKLDNLAVSIKEAQHRVNGIIERNDFTAVCKLQGVKDYAQATNKIYHAALGVSAKEIKQAATGDGKASGSARSYLKDHAIRLLEWVEGLAADVALDTDESVVDLAERFANQATCQLEQNAKSKLKEYREKPLTPSKARKLTAK